MDLDIQNGAKLEAQGAAGSEHRLGGDALDSNPSREQRIRVTGTGSALVMTNLPASIKATAKSRFEVLDGASATFSNFAFDLGGIGSAVMVVSNATLTTGPFSGGVWLTSTVSVVNSTVTSAGRVYVADYHNTDSMTLDNSTWTLSGDRLVIASEMRCFLVMTNNSRMIGTNADLYCPGSAEGTGYGEVLVSGTGSVLDLHNVCVGGSYNNPAGVGGMMTIAGGAKVLSRATDVNYYPRIWANGIMRLSGGTLSNAIPLILEAGVLEGSGTVVESIIVNDWYPSGKVRPGGTNAVGQLNCGNTYNQKAASNGRLELEIGGTAPGTGYDVLSVTSTVTIAGGAIAVSKLAGYKPPPGFSTYDVITGSSVSTSGATLTLPPNNEVATWTAAVVDIAGGRKALRVTALGAGPSGTVIQLR